MPPPMLRPLGVGEILDTSFTLYRRHFGPLVTVSLVCTGLPLLLRLFTEAAGGMLANLSLTLVYLLSMVVLSLVATGATVFIVSESYLGRPLSAGDALRRATSHLGGILVSSMLTAFIVGLGLVFLIIPGIILGVGLAVAVPAVVLEPGRSGSAALSRSWELTRGSRWRMFGLGVTLLILLYIPFVAITGILAMILPGAGGALAMATSPSTVVALAVGGIVQLVLYPLFYCVLTIAYYDLRVRKEGFDLELLASSLQQA
jgi:hypothetical protein